MILTNNELKNKVIDIFKKTANQFIVEIESAVDSGNLKYREFEEVAWRDPATLKTYPIVKVDGFDILMSCVQNNPEDYFEELYKPHLPEYYTVNTRLTKFGPKHYVDVKLNFVIKPVKPQPPNVFERESEKSQIFTMYYVYVQANGSHLDVIHINDIDEKFEMFKLIKRVAETYKRCAEKMLLNELNTK